MNKLKIESQKLKVGRDFLILLLLLLISCFKLYRINGGLVLGEPDEFTHAELARNFHQSPWPYAENYGGPWYFELPLFPFLGFLFSFIFRDQYYLSLRLVSWLASVFLVWGLYLYLKYKLNGKVGLAAALVFLFSPLAVYYSRLGVLEMAVFSFASLFLFTIDFALAKKSWPASAASGFFLGLALLAKYSAFIFVALLGVCFLYSLVGENFKGWRPSNWKKKFAEKEAIVLNLYLTTAAVIFFVTVFPVAFVLRQHDPYHFKHHLLTNLGQIRDFWWTRGRELSVLSYLPDLPFWFTWPVIFLSLFGLFYALKNWRSFRLLLAGFFLTAVFVLPRTPFYPRYSFSLIPFLSVFSAFGLWEVFLRFKSRFNLPFSLCLLLFVLLLLPSAGEALLATRHRLVEDVGVYIKNQREENPWVFANYWPIFFGQAAGSEKATWLADSVWEAKAFVPDASKPPLEILVQEGGFVVLEKLYATSPIFVHPESRLKAFRFVENSLNPQKVIVDPSPNFPHFRESYNEAKVYRVEKGQ